MNSFAKLGLHFLVLVHAECTDLGAVYIFLHCNTLVYCRHHLFLSNDDIFVDGWIMYKLPDGYKHTLVAYDIVSANDAPERDPMDWYEIQKI